MSLTIYKSSVSGCLIRIRKSWVWISLTSNQEVRLTDSSGWFKQLSGHLLNYVIWIGDLLKCSPEIGSYSDTQPRFKVIQSIPHVGEVNRARYMPQNPDLIATYVTSYLLSLDITSHWRPGLLSWLEKPSQAMFTFLIGPSTHPILQKIMSAGLTLPWGDILKKGTFKFRNKILPLS
jgi:hypothetical protein